MDIMEKITDLRAQKKALKEQSEALYKDEKFDELDAITDKMEAINKNIQALERNLEASRQNAEPIDGQYDGILHDDKTGEATAYMFPAPENIGSLNALSRLMTMLTCEKAAKGPECGSCPDLPSCRQMKAADGSFRHMAEGGK